MPSGFGPVAAGAATVFFAVFGYDAMSTAVEESTDCKKHKSKASIFSLITTKLLYTVPPLLLAGRLNYQGIDPTSGFDSAFNSVGLPGIVTIFSVFVIQAILTAILTFLLGVTHAWFSKIDRRGTPQRVTWISGIASTPLAGLFPVKAVADLNNIGVLAAFVVLCLS